MALLPQHSIFLELEAVDSTNNYARNLVANNLAQNNLVVFAHSQTHGRGQMGKKWHTLPNQNITMSVLVDVSSVLLHQQFFLTAVAALGVLDFFKKYVTSHIAIKWMNDIYYKDNKAAGILIETANAGNKRWAIIGIGVNINQESFTEELPHAVSLHQITGKKYNIVELARQLSEQVNLRLQDILQVKFAKILADYNTYLYKKNEIVTFKKDNIKFTAIINSVDENGDLIVSNCLYEKFSLGEVQWINSV